MRKGTSVEADYWALGVLIFEMLVGDPPFKSLSGDPWDTFRQTLSGRFFVPANISSAAADLIYKLLQVCSALPSCVPRGLKLAALAAAKCGIGDELSKCSSQRNQKAHCAPQVSPEKRLGSGPLGAEEIKAHHWFTDFEWEKMAERKLRAPFVPRIKDVLDTSNFDSFEKDDLPRTAPGRSDKYADQWEGLWDWIDDPPAQKAE